MNFIFGSERQPNAPTEAEVPGGIENKAALLEALFLALHFPEYFGGNWDALEECIRDLSWLPPGDVVVRHEALPLSDDRASLSTYLAILTDAMKKWKATGERRLFIVFPLSAEAVVRSILADAEKSGDLSEGGIQ
jgi:hypothetical protein